MLHLCRPNKNIAVIMYDLLFHCARKESNLVGFLVHILCLCSHKTAVLNNFHVARVCVVILHHIMILTRSFLVFLLSYVYC